MKLRKIEIASLVLVLATFVGAALVYPYLPDQIASHWGINGEVNGYMGKFWGVYLLPFIMLGCAILFFAIPRIDPKKQNIQKFEKYYNWFVLTFLLFFVYIYKLIIFWNLGYQFDMMRLMVPALALLFYVLGIMVSHAEPNWFIGIRTPWTLSSEDVWYKTHKLGGKLFRVVAVVSLLGVVIPQYAIWLLVLPILAVALYLVVYSYLEYHKQ